MNKFKKVLSFMFAAVLAISMAACTTAGKSKANSDVVTLKWVTVGGGMPANYESWKNQVNAYMGEKIGVNIEMEIVGWGDWETRRSVVVNTSGDFDVLFTNLETYTTDVGLNAFVDLTDLLPKTTPELYNMLPQDYWDATRVNGQIYAVPTYKDSSQTQYFVWDKDLVEKLDIDVEKLKTLESLTPALEAIKEETGKPSAQLAFSAHMNQIIHGWYDNMSTGLYAIGVGIGDAAGKVVATMEQPNVMRDLRQIREWYKSGLVNSDAATKDTAEDYRPFQIAQGWSGAAKTAWGPKMGVDAVAVQYGDTIMTNDTVRGSMNSISVNCKYPEKALEMLQLVNTDTHLRDMFYYGEEGVNWDYTADGLVHKNNNDWNATVAGYTQGSFFTVSQTDDVDFNQWDEVKQLNESAIPSVLLGFTFNTKVVEDKLSNCLAIYNNYKAEIFTGTVDPDTAVAAMMKEMRAAGFDDIAAEAQKQVDAFLAK